MRRLIHRLILVAALLAFPLGCLGTPPHPYTLAPGHEGAPGVEAFLLLPLNLTVSLPSELEASSEGVSDAILDYLREAGRDVSDLSFHAAREEWDRTVNEVEASASLLDDFPTAARRFVERLRESRDFDVMIMPNLVYRDGKIRGRFHVVCDGVRRRIERRKRIPASLKAMRCVSLSVMVFDREGAMVFESYGGLDLPVAIDFEEYRITFPLREDRLTDVTLLREGIGVAFDPYILRVVPPEEESTVASP